MCPIGPAIISRAGGSVLTAARLSRTVLDGRIGKSPLHLAAANGQIVGDRFGLNQFDMRIGKSQSPISVAAAHLLGRFSGNVMEGTFSGGRSTIGDVKLLISDAAGRWRFANSRLSLNGALNLSRAQPAALLQPAQQRLQLLVGRRQHPRWRHARPSGHGHSRHRRDGPPHTVDGEWSGFARRPD